MTETPEPAAGRIRVLRVRHNATRMSMHVDIIVVVPARSMMAGLTFETTHASIEERTRDIAWRVRDTMNLSRVDVMTDPKDSPDVRALTRAFILSAAAARLSTPAVELDHAAEH